MTIELTGEYTDAQVMGLEREDVEENVLDQIQVFIDHGAFTEPVRVMPDTHVGAGCTIGFTMPFRDKIVPNAVGVDVGCGMASANYRDMLDAFSLKALDLRIRESIPMGFNVHQDTDYHMGEDFPWYVCGYKLGTLEESLGDDTRPAWFDGYDIDYYKRLCKRVGYDVSRGINSLGTLGGGNHFIELAESEKTGDHWITIHSGSRGIGLAVAQHWQAKATEYRTEQFIQENVPEEYWKYVVPDHDDPELVDWFQGGKGQSYIDSEKIRDDVSNSYQIAEVHDAIRAGHPQERPGDTGHDWVSTEDLDWLEGEEARGYFIDMIFAQTYAQESRRQMFRLIEEALGVSRYDYIESVHNYLDFEDTTIRKGACRAHEGERIILPFNMRDGTLILEGKGNEEWNRSSPHGAGRVMSRTQAKGELDAGDVEKEMADADVYTSTIPLDEAPDAYKPADLIEEAIGPTADVVDRLVPYVNIKAE